VLSAGEDGTALGDERKRRPDAEKLTGVSLENVARWHEFCEASSLYVLVTVIEESFLEHLGEHDVLAREVARRSVRAEDKRRCMCTSSA